MKWQYRFLGQALMASTFSKDPSTKVGAVIARGKNEFISLGYNGLPKEIQDDPEILENRELKYKYIIHAEENAVYNSELSTHGCDVYLTHPPCGHCAGVLKQNGIKTIYYLEPTPEFKQRWDMTETLKYLDKLKIKHDSVPMPVEIRSQLIDTYTKLWELGLK